MYLSVVTTLYHSAPYIEEFYRRIKICLQEITGDYEIIFVNDGSPDDSLAIAVSLYDQDKQVKVIDLSRNFGHHKALMTGLSYAKGDLVFLIDVDLEEAPENLTLFYNELNKQAVDVIYGVQKKRKGQLPERFTGKIYYILFNLLTGYKAEANALIARLMTRNYVRALVEHKEHEFDIMGLWTLTGFRQTSITVNKSDKGSTVYSLRRKLSLFINTVTAFSNRPLLAILFLGVIICILSGMAAFYFWLKHLFLESAELWILLIISVWMVGGLIITCLGIIGLYISKIHIETKRRPYTIIRRIYGGENV